MPEIPEARTGWQRRVVSAIGNLIAGKSDDYVRERIQAGGKFLSSDQIDQILGEAYSSVNAGNRIGVMMTSGTGTPERTVESILQRPKEAVVDINISDDEANPQWRTQRIYLPSGETLQDLQDEIQAIIDQWNEKYESDIASDAFRIRYILMGQ